MQHAIFRSLTLYTVLALAGIALPVVAEVLKGEEIITTISGKTIAGYNVEDNKQVTWFFAQDGVAKLRRNNLTWTGKWRIDDIGRLCVQFRDPYSDTLKKEGCRAMAREDGKLVMYGLKKDGQRAGDTLSIEKITEGNTDNL